MSTISLTGREQRRLLRAQDALLAPVAKPGGDEQWELRANRAVREFLGADHSVFAIPGEEDALPPMITNDTDPSMPDRLYRYVEGWESTHYAATDPWLEVAIRRRLEGGLGGYHLDELLDPEQQAASAAIQDVFVPAGMSAMMGLSLPLPDGEATQFFGFEDPGDPGYGERGLRKLRLLVPAFGAGVRAHLQRRRRGLDIAATLDRLDQPAGLYDAGGRLLHRNRALEEALADEPEPELIARTMDELAETFAARRRDPAPARERLPASVETSVETASGARRIWATCAARGRVLVRLEEIGPRLPDPEVLVESHDLTPREAEVALLLARGASDRALARELEISWHTARVHVRNVLGKLGLSSRAAVAVALLGAGRRNRR